MLIAICLVLCSLIAAFFIIREANKLHKNREEQTQSTYEDAPSISTASPYQVPLLLRQQDLKQNIEIELILMAYTKVFLKPVYKNSLERLLSQVSSSSLTEEEFETIQVEFKDIKQNLEKIGV